MWTVETYRKDTGDTIRRTNFDDEAEMRAFLEKSGKPSGLMGIRTINNARVPTKENPYGIYPVPNPQERKGPKLKKRPPPDIIA